MRSCRLKKNATENLNTSEKSTAKRVPERVWVTSSMQHTLYSVNRFNLPYLLNYKLPKSYHHISSSILVQTQSVHAYHYLCINDNRNLLIIVDFQLVSSTALYTNIYKIVKNTNDILLLLFKK